MKKIRIIFLYLLRPGVIWTISLTALAIVLLAYIIIGDIQKSLVAYISYAFFTYVLVMLISGFPDIIQKAKALISRNRHVDRYISDLSLRTKISLYMGLFVNLVFAAFYVFMSWCNASAWFGAVAVYYIILSTMRFILLKSIRKTTLQENQHRRFVYELRSHCICGYLMFLLNMGMAGMIIQMVWQNKGYVYPGLIIYISAVYTFYSLITATINMVKSRRMDSPVLSAAKMLGFAGTLMSMLALQTAMISQFGADDDSFRQIMNTASGGGAFLIVFCMAIFMVVRAKRELKKIQIYNS